MKIKYLIFLIFLINSFVSNALSNDVEFEAKDLKIIGDGNKIVAYNSKTIVPSDETQIKSEKVEYDKQTKILKFYKNVVFNDLKNNIEIKSNEIIYKRDINLIFSSGDTEINIKNKYDIKSKDIYLNRNQNQIYGINQTVVKDSEKNTYILEEKFNLDLVNDLIKANKSTIIDNQKNKYFFEDLVINTRDNEIAGKELKVEFENSYFGNSENDPLLKGKSAYSDEKELKIYKAVFSTCNTSGKKCRGWEVNSKEFKHDKSKKIFEYKNSWLKLFDFKLFYLPYFNHPDPSVKRKSGFLTPSYKSSENLGTSINFPYFKVLGEDKDITFSPRYYADKSFLLQNEYRQALENSNILSDFSFLVGETGTKAHLFYNIGGNFDNSTSYELNLQSVKGDNYLKNHKLKETSNLIDDENLLISNFDVKWDFKDSKFDTSFKVYEDLSIGNTDRYQYIFPEYNFSKNIKVPDSYNGVFNFITNGYNKNYSTNINESVLINNFHFKSNDVINKRGIVTNYDLLLKNSNSYSENSNSFKENGNYQLFETIKIENNFPLIKKDRNVTYYLKPKTSFRFSPNGNSDLSEKDLVIDYNNAFSLNRISTNSQVEGGAALSIGLEFQKNDNIKGNLIDFRIGNILKPNKDFKLPTKSKLDQTRSDVFGDLKVRLTDNVNLGYAFSYDRDLDFSNLDSLLLNIGVNNFVTKFDYYTENHDFGDKENVKNITSYNFNDENSILFSTSRDLKNDFTEYYNLTYEYVTDCISVNFNFNKSFYSDGNLEPDNTLSFLIKIIPFTELGVPNIGDMISK